jgi:hypothetical protein
MIASFEYHCKFCNKPGVVEYEVPPAGMFNVELYKKYIACDRCSDYERGRRDLFELICRLATILVQCRQSLITDESKEKVVREKLVVATKRFANTVCDFFRKPFAWEPDIVESIMQQPTNAGTILSGYLRAMARTEEAE